MSGNHAAAAAAHRRFLLDSATIAENNDLFLQNGRDFECEARLREPFLGKRTMSWSTGNRAGADTEISHLTFNEPFIGYSSVDATRTVAGKGGAESVSKAHIDLSRPLFSRDNFDSKTFDNKDALLFATHGVFNRPVFSASTVDTETKDAAGDLLQTSHTVINRSFWGGKTLDTEYCDRLGKKIGDSHSTVSDPHMGTLCSVFGGIGTVGGIAALASGRWKLGLATTVIGLGMFAAGYNMPHGLTVQTKFHRY